MIYYMSIKNFKKKLRKYQLSENATSINIWNDDRNEIDTFVPSNVYIPPVKTKKRRKGK